MICLPYVRFFSLGKTYSINNGKKSACGHTGSRHLGFKKVFLHWSVPKTNIHVILDDCDFSLSIICFCKILILAWKSMIVNHHKRHVDKSDQHESVWLNHWPIRMSCSSETKRHLTKMDKRMILVRLLRRHGILNWNNNTLQYRYSCDGNYLSPHI